MKKNIYRLMCLAILSYIGMLPLKAQFSGNGSGTLADPYRITNPTELNEVRNKPYAHYRLMNDIDLSEWIATNSRTKGWAPIGNAKAPFAGTFDGGGHVISGLWIKMPGTNDIGLFGRIYGTSNVEIKNLGVVIDKKGINGQNHVGGIIGYIHYTRSAFTDVILQSVFVQGDVSGIDGIGGIVGHSIGNLTLMNSYAGNGTIKGTMRVGGLVAVVERDTKTIIKNCYAANTIETSIEAGNNILSAGIIASAGGGATEASSAPVAIINCMVASPSITSVADKASCSGRIIAWYKFSDAMTLKNIAYEETMINDAKASSSGWGHKNGQNKKQSELTDINTYINLGWDFDNVWKMGNDDYPYPVLKNMPMDKQPTKTVGSSFFEIPAILSDNMILQHNSLIRLWGKTKSGEKVHIHASWNKNDISLKANVNGEWETMVQTTDAGGPHFISISSIGKRKIIKNILLGEVWICAGQSNMTMPVKGWSDMPIANSAEIIKEASAYDDIRMITVTRRIANKKEFNVGGSWKNASTSVGDFSAVGYLYALELKKKLEVPIGIIHLSWPGSTIQAWTSYDMLRLFPEVDLSTAIKLNGTSKQRTPAVLYNAMFYPISKFTVKGIVWYQGEDNVGAHQLYSKLFPAMVKNWREAIGLGDIPFYYVQLAPYKYQGSNLDKSALLREVQLKSQSIIPNAAMITTGDLGEEENIHPAKKMEIAQRLAYLALFKTYGFNTLPYTAACIPIYTKTKLVGNKIILAFNHANKELSIKGDAKTAFEIAGDDNAFYPAEAKVSEHSKVELEVWSENVSIPKQVRYCFRNYFKCVLFNAWQIPISPFRTEITQ